MEQSLTILIPTLNAAAMLPATLGALAEALGCAGPAGLTPGEQAPPAWDAAGVEVIVADGGSGDGTVALARQIGARVVAAPPGRGGQLAAGAAAATGAWLLVLHADTRLGPGWPAAVRAFMATPANRERAAYFTFALDDASPEARRLERWVAWRCRRLALPYGDQGLLLARTLYHQAGGYRPVPLMEDVDLVRRLGRRRLAALPVAALTSAVRWQREGWLRRSARNLACLSLWFCGVPPRVLRRLYG